MIPRALAVVMLCLLAGALSTHATGAEVSVPRVPLADLPLQLDAWTGRAAKPFPDDVVTQLGVDDYVNRHYFAAGQAPVSVYIGYYDQQRQGDAIHSPQNCLPGAGWQPVESTTHELAGGVRVNRYVIQKGIDRQVVLYWYQGRGRIVANEYANKALLMYDAARVRRTSGGLVRLIAPVTSSVDAAVADLSRFAEALLPHLTKHLP